MKLFKVIKKNKKKIILFLLLCLIITLLYFGISKIVANIRTKNIDDLNWLNKNIEIIKNKELGENVNYVKTKKYVDVFKLNYQNTIEEKINKLLGKNSYTFSNPLLIYNPYGTNNLGVNVYFNTDKNMEVSYEISVGNKIEDFKRTLNNDSASNYSKEHNYQIIGFVPGYKNILKLIAKDELGNKIEKEFTIDMRGISINSDTILDSKKGKSTYELTDGLFVLFGLDKAFNANNYIYDNNGVIRADLVINDYRSDKIIFDEGKMYYSYDINKIGVINRLGKVEKTYELENYEMHHDYVYDKVNNKLLILVNSTLEEDKTIEDLIVSLDMKTGEVKEIIDMKDLMPETYKTAKMPESGINTYGGTGLDWIHLNSLDLVSSKEDIVVSARETSTIIYISNIYDNPSIKYLIADPEVYKDTEYSSLVLNKQKEFINQAGQHTITYVEDSSLDNGQYYLEVYNNNYGASNTRLDFPWDKYPGVGDFVNGTASKYYKFLVNENNNTYDLVEEFDVSYSSIVSSIQDIDENHVTSSGKSNCYAEYDKLGKLIKQFNYTSKKYAYRVFKYSFNDIWFK